MYKTTEMLAAEAKRDAEGSGHTTVEFQDNLHHRDEILNRIPSLQYLKCDIMLEMYIVDTIENKKFLPNLRIINRLPLNVKQLGDRYKQQKVLKIMDLMWRYVGTYRLVKPGVMDEDPCFYIPDEVGCSITHSDTPNCRMMPFIYSPNATVDDAATITYSIVWPTEPIKKEGYLQRDFLAGITEQEFRSARLFPWFNVYEEYYLQELEKWKAEKPNFNAMQRHEEY